ncbi:hypothetical protein HDV05_000871 [Chytridiales sp. JEL 0842]|nr:hypothetical protein HDV05_000871 [Chytridiales sp. JEL 0842]
MYVGGNQGPQAQFALRPATTQRPSNNTMLRKRSTKINNPAPIPLGHPTNAFEHRTTELQPMLTTSNTIRRAEASKTLFKKPDPKKNAWTPPNPWVAFSWAVTCCFPAFFLQTCFRIKGAGPQQAWREKVALCVIVAVLSGFVLFYIVFFNALICPLSKSIKNNVPVNAFGGVVVRGIMYDSTLATSPYNTLFADLASTFGGVDVTSQFQQPVLPSCAPFAGQPFADLKFQCEMDNPPTCLDIQQLYEPNGGVYGLRPYIRTPDNVTLTPVPAYSWSQVKRRNLVVINKVVLNFNSYLQQNPTPIPNSPVDAFIRSAQIIRDASRLVAKNPLIRGSVAQCLREKYVAGMLDTQEAECTFTFGVTLITTGIVMGIIGIRFIMALVFNWFISARLSRTPKPNKIRERSYYETIPPLPPLRSLAPITNANSPNRSSFLSASNAGSDIASFKRQSQLPSVLGTYDTDLHTVLLVTCYSEGETSLRNTLESLAATDYHDEKKLLFVVADGIVTGKGNAKSTPDTLIDMIELDDMLGREPKAYSYVAVASGAKAHNMAKVYCGHFVHKARRIPTILVIKCGTPAEQKDAKPGNRGKRDSQLILMNLFSRLTLYDRLTPLDWDLSRKIHHITGFTPDFYEIVLMVDADTRVMPSSLRLMVNCMYNDPSVMGLCGETEIDNKQESWVTMIQVFEYYISHHLGKAFESVFGGVTCLPGCFCMYRLKAPRETLTQTHEGYEEEASSENGGVIREWVPLLVNPDIVSEYSTSDVTTLHQKNLLLLGEDRFLSTLMLRSFPKRKMMFVPKALCRTVVPNDFKTLLSQRRRWINSTIHNLMELVLIRNLCGTFCFSMQFVVFMDLIGTAILPIGLALTYYLIYVAAAKTQYSADPTTWANTATLVGVIFLPAVLVLLTARKITLILWMLLYLLALPIWQFILPLYAFWNFDDFSWGATRQVDGQKESKSGHGDEGGMEEEGGKRVLFRRWEEYEAVWRKSIIKQRRESAQTLLGSEAGSGLAMDYELVDERELM